MSKPVVIHSERADFAARATKAIHEGICASIIRLRSPVQREGKACSWRIVEERIVRDLLANTTAKTLLREEFAETEAEARATLKRMVRESLKSPEAIEHQKAAAKFNLAVKKAEADQGENLLSAPAPVGGEKIGKYDLEDYAKARAALLREKYPRLIDAMERKAKADEIERAYTLDVAELTGEIHAESIAPDRELIAALAKAATPRKDASNKARAMAALRTEILRGWFADRFCWMSNTERAEAIRKRGLDCTAESIRKEISRMNLATKRKDGAPVRKNL